MSEWCFQCGVAAKPERAVGWDEDGEPACAMHSVKAKRPFSLAAHDELAPLKTEPIVVKLKPAAPSPVQIKQEKEMIPEKICACGCDEMFKPTGNRQLYAAGHKPIRKKPAKKLSNIVREPKPSPVERIDRLTDHVNREIGVAQDVPLHLRVDVGGGASQGCATTERLITLQLGESKVQKLLNLLLRD